MVVQEQGSSGIFVGLLIQPSQAAGGVDKWGSPWLRIYGQGSLLTKEHLTPTCVEVKSLNSNRFERLPHLYEIEP